MRLFKDSQLQEEITTLDLGVVSAGDKKKFTFWVLNDSNAKLENIKFQVSHKEVFILEAPTELSKKESSKLVVEWEPSVTVKQGLQTLLKISASELWS